MDDDEDGKIDRWKQISAEEVSAELVAALREQDTGRFVRLLISQDEIDSLGLGRDKSERISAKSDRAARDFKALAARQKSVGRERSLGPIRGLAARHSPERNRRLDQGRGGL